MGVPWPGVGTIAVDAHPPGRARSPGAVTPADPGARFAELVGGPEEDLSLDEASLLIAAHAHPGLDMPAQIGRLDALAAGCPAPTLDALRHHLFEVEGFRGDTRRYADPRNSFLDDVLSRRRGIPISLAVVTMEVGRRLGIHLVGVGMPGHFLVRHTGVPPVVIDAFDGGRVLDGDGCRQLFRSLFGPRATFAEHLLAPVGPRAILARMLTNLRGIYRSAGDARALGWVLDLRAAIPGAGPAELAERASAQAALARFGEAAATLDTAAELLPPERAARARARAALLRASLN